MSVRCLTSTLLTAGHAQAFIFWRTTGEYKSDWCVRPGFSQRAMRCPTTSCVAACFHLRAALSFVHLCVKLTLVCFGCRSKVYGLTLLVFSDSDCKISEVLTFMQPFPSQRRELLKPQLQ